MEQHKYPWLLDVVHPKVLHRKHFDTARRITFEN
jgi:hypothetical protein